MASASDVLTLFARGTEPTNYSFTLSAHVARFTVTTRAKYKQLGWVTFACERSRVTIIWRPARMGGAEQCLQVEEQALYFMRNPMDVLYAFVDECMAPERVIAILERIP